VQQYRFKSWKVVALFERSNLPAECVDKIHDV
jgi:hypothetical protein